MARRNHAVQMVEAVERLIRPVGKFRRALQTHGENLRIRQIRGGARNGKPFTGKKNREDAGIAIEKARKGEERLRDQVGAAKSGNVAGQPEAEMIVKEAPA